MNLQQHSERNWRQLAERWLEAHRNDVQPPSLSLLCLAGVLGMQIEPQARADEVFKKAPPERLPFLRSAIFGDPARWRPNVSPIDDALNKTNQRDPEFESNGFPDPCPEPRSAVTEHWIARGVCACRANEQSAAARWLRRLITNRATGHMGTQAIARFLYCSQAADGSFGMNESVYYKLAGELGSSAPEYILILKAELTFQTAWALDCFEHDHAGATDNAVAAPGGRL
ncbi:MAG: hypothetical protein WD397_02360 [Wenzhouxiangellaceae bacterium]